VRKAFETTYEINGKKRWALAILGAGQQSNKSGNHFHVEITSRKPQKTSDAEIEAIDSDEFQKLIGRMIGKDISVSVTGHFRLPRSKIPAKSIIRPRFFEAGEEPTSIKTTRMDFEINGLFFPRLIWRRPVSGKGFTSKCPDALAAQSDETI
jgi:hypothetical protein